MDNIYSSIQDLCDSECFWKYFKQISGIPRQSSKEDKIAAWILTKITEWNFEFQKDKFGNIVVQVPASKNILIDTPKLAIQSHLDMVCEKQGDSQHNFDNDPIQLNISKINNTQYLHAHKTTLGADNGIAIAYQLCLMDPSSNIPHGPLEMIFTLEEEIGLKGANNFDASLISSKYMINIDNFWEDMCCIGSSGGEELLATFNITRDNLVVINPDTYSIQRISISGLAGGHSGADILGGRKNALKILAQIVHKILESFEIQLITLEGGDKINAIPREAECLCYIETSVLSAAQTFIHNFQADLYQELVSEDKLFELTMTSVSQENIQKIYYPISTYDTKKFLEFITQIPNGVLDIHKGESEYPSLSANLSKIVCDESKIVCSSSIRFTNSQVYNQLLTELDSLYKKYELSYTKKNYYSAWEPSQYSRLKNLFISTYKELFSKPVRAERIHVGIECGIIKAKCSHDVDTICIGPHIQGAHSPHERLDINSAERIWKLLQEILLKI